MLPIQHSKEENLKPDLPSEFVKVQITVQTSPPDTPEICRGF